MLPEELTRFTFHHVVGLALLLIPLVPVLRETRGVHRLRCAYLIVVPMTLQAHLTWLAVFNLDNFSRGHQMAMWVVWLGVLPLALSGVSFREAVGRQFQAPKPQRRVAWLGAAWLGWLLLAVCTNVWLSDVSFESVRSYVRAAGAGHLVVGEIAPVVLEEFLFRGVLWAILPREWPMWERVVMTTCAFAGPHAMAGYPASWLVFSVVPTGVLLGLLRGHYGFWAAVLVHLVTNVCIEVITWL